ncbi:hypothetical protein F3Y22_tig00008235pilonHSYRG00006 [Hibiscus syriacus]|uniref:Reverse transcriptase domain-containing protein n=1 Tax=Hibiscus syriacus TaxID=106335 RepID=A0A6A3CAV1_HIBSY|nr:hypothetical protein F3Y22_tig00008235pilonHSYRG00006 [Hibiscus syriacus]
MVAAVTGDGTVLGRNSAECNHVERILKMVVAISKNEENNDAKDKAKSRRGTMFAFVRTDSMSDTRRIIGKRINHCRISVSLAKNGRSTSKWKKALSENNRPQVFVRSGVTSDQLLHSKKRITGHVEDEEVWKLKMCLVGDMMSETPTKPEQARVNIEIVDKEKSHGELVFHSGQIKSKERADKVEPILGRASLGSKVVEDLIGMGFVKALADEHPTTISSWDEDFNGFMNNLFCAGRRIGKYGSMLNMQDNVLSKCDRKKRDKALKRHKRNYKADILLVQEMKKEVLLEVDIQKFCSSERRGGVGTIVVCKEFNEFIANYKLVDLSMRDKKFTWYGLANRSCRLVRFLLDEKWFFGGGNFEQFVLKRIVSDHVSVMLVSDDVDWDPKPCNKSDLMVKIMLEPSAHPMEHRKQNSTVSPAIQVKNLDGKVNELEEKGNVSGLSAQDQLKLKILMELWEALRVQEEMWRQKSCIRWLALGNLDTSFFQKVVKSCSVKIEIGGVVLKLDFSKAYDCVSVSVLVNRSPTKEFRIRRGLRQGDSLSSFLFIIVTEVLHRLFIKEEMSGINVDSTLVSDLAKCCRCKVGLLPFSYMGIPLGADPRKIKTWDPIIEKFQAKLAGWMRNSLSFAGRVTLINVIFSALPMYFMYLFEVPKLVVHKLDKIRGNFLGSGVINLRAKNEALLSKWGWRFGVEKQALWRRVISSKYGNPSDNELLNSSNFKYMSIVWEAIVRNWSNVIGGEDAYGFGWSSSFSRALLDHEWAMVDTLWLCCGVIKGNLLINEEAWWTNSSFYIIPPSISSCCRHPSGGDVWIFAVSSMVKMGLSGGGGVLKSPSIAIREVFSFPVLANVAGGSDVLAIKLVVSIVEEANFGQMKCLVGDSTSKVDLFWITKSLSHPMTLWFMFKEIDVRLSGLNYVLIGWLSQGGVVQVILDKFEASPGVG